MYTKFVQISKNKIRIRNECAVIKISFILTINCAKFPFVSSVENLFV